MKKILTTALLVSAALGAASAAQARDGCGGGFHRGPWGHCRPNGYGYGGPVVVAPEFGVFYAGRGYWDGHRYWMHRDRWHGGWRYR